MAQESGGVKPVDVIVTAGDGAVGDDTALGWDASEEFVVDPSCDHLGLGVEVLGDLVDLVDEVAADLSADVVEVTCCHHTGSWCESSV